MVVLTPAEFIKKFCVDFPCLDHHYTGPPANQQPQGHGSVFQIEGKILAGLAARVGGSILEIGADQGVSTRYLHEGLARHPSSSHAVIYSVDNNHKWPEDRAWPLRYRVAGDSRSYAPPKDCRLAFIDGDHRYEGVCRDINVVTLAKIPRVLFHDTGVHFDKEPTNASNGSQARRAVLEALQEKEWDLYEVSTPCGLIYATRKEAQPPMVCCDPSAGSGGCCDGVAF